MSFIRRIARRSTAIVLASGFAKAMPGQEEKPVEPDSLAGGARPFGLVINGFAAGNFHYGFNTDENGFGSSALAVSLFRAVSERVFVLRCGPTPSTTSAVPARGAGRSCAPSRSRRST